MLLKFVPHSSLRR